MFDVIVVLIVLIFLIAMYLAFGYLIVSRMTRPAREQSTKTPADFGLEYESISISSTQAWYIKCPEAQATIVCAPPFGGTSLKIQGNDAGEFWRELAKRGYSIISLPSFDDEMIRQAIRFLMNEGIPAENIVLMGFSIGASTALYTASKMRVGAVIADGAADDLLTEIFADFRRHPWMRLLIPSLQVVMRFNRRVNVASFHALASIQKAHCPVLLIYGDEESIVLQRMNAALIEECESRQSVQIWHIPNTSHCMGPTEQPRAYAERISEFLLEL